MEQRKSHINDKGNAQAGARPARQNTDVMCDGGLSRSSEETPVMWAERRADVVQLELDFTTLGNQGMTKPILTKGIPITKQMVYEAYKKVKRNKGAAGIDNESLEDFDRNLAKNLYKKYRGSQTNLTPEQIEELDTHLQVKVYQTAKEICGYIKKQYYERYSAFRYYCMDFFNKTEKYRNEFSSLMTDNFQFIEQ